MSLFNEFLEPIEAYEEGRLSPDQRQQFEQQLQTDQALRDALAEYRVFRHSIESVRVKEQLSKIRDQLEANGMLTEAPITPYMPAVRVGRWRWVAAASVVLVLVSIGIWWSIPATSDTAQKVYMAYYKPEPVMRGIDCPTNFTASIGQYRAGNYQATLASLRLLPNTEPCALYYEGLCLLALNQPEAAITSLESAQPRSSGSLQQRAEWYLALAYLKNDDVKAAQDQLQKIIRQPNHSFGMVARQALSQLVK